MDLVAPKGADPKLPLLFFLALAVVGIIFGVLLGVCWAHEFSKVPGVRVLAAYYQLHVGLRHETVWVSSFLRSFGVPLELTSKTEWAAIATVGAAGSAFIFRSVLPFLGKALAA